MYAKLLADGSIKAPYYLVDLQRDYPHTSFPSTITQAVLDEFGVAVVSETPPPEVDLATSRATYTVVRNEGKYQQVWEVTHLPVETASQNVRERRDDKFRATDWSQIPDATVNQTSWASYRQALRDVPQQAGFPFSVVWPNPPTGL